ncbi:hypothetical protein CHGG_09734 [Chaetomium globosum CBS 148.51]|uniref:Uncharacterized protein n=1 Tax=Chaetomium globosum (strain ATCC 6205 / CBS 148.51 / DSM 1962 / NBRC 6347 / NRRL 1970) TaxID=306901 RepID=Q2GQM0_CHAGB|nr:uncharacterized protein CHGG_09734 [Chaetomium globosum CBS 148.51]EAQ83330.1 hypothetical protein CHGG_09734 [Chaetomium globosum CBS 148.51]
MAPKSKARLTPSTKSTTTSSSSPPHPFKPAPAALQPFCATLPPGHVYITHVDPRPSAAKRKLFLIPIGINLTVIALFVWRVAHITPYYLALAMSMLGHSNETTLQTADLTWAELGWAVARRAATFLLDFVLGVFVWPWPYEFFVGTTGRGSPVAWRWAVGFRDREVYVRRSRDGWDGVLRKEKVDLFDSEAAEAREGRDAILSRVRTATAPMFMQQKTGYLTMNGEWDLDWRGMVDATRLVDSKEIALEAFGTVVLLHHAKFGWVSVDLGNGDNAEQDERRRQVMAFRDALAALGKEDLFFRWVEMIQFETDQPGGFTREKQVVAAQKIRDMFKTNGVDFDGLWKEAVGTDGLAGRVNIKSGLSAVRSQNALVQAARDLEVRYYPTT